VQGDSGCDVLGDNHNASSGVSAHAGPAPLHGIPCCYPAFPALLSLSVLPVCRNYLYFVGNYTNTFVQYFLTMHFF
jgi:hypothetical protein